MKILLLSADNLYLVPYKDLYISILKKNNIDYDIVYWDKTNSENINKNNYIRYNPKGKTKLKKFVNYIKFRHIIKKKICENKYDYIIGFHQIVNLLIADILLKHFKKKFIYDVRDYSYEYMPFVRWIEYLLVKSSKMNIISSEGFEKFLPKSNYHIVHNLPPVIDEQYKQLKNNEKFERVVISYIGLIRFFDQNYKIINFFANDDRFLLQFFGTGSEKLRDYCVKENILNVSFIGTFPQNMTLEYYNNTDLIMNLYGNDTPLLDYALSNKLYYSASLYKPILVCKGTYMEEISHQFGFGYTLELKSDNEKDALFRYIKNIDRKTLIKNCNRFMEKVSLEHSKVVNELDNVLRNKK
ncbi:glycosyltransferase family 4 protein [Streptococcus catagoni]|uniref:glycosyltransferase family 4 protein n=1 Tax=Streptococcus catagoni TaxID=2654874 RepID=UPI00140CDCA8|nr:glycosyltransferase family 4 protein [Streptococcus catagoni]